MSKQAELELERAWKWRDERGLFGESEALRVFHGPGEGTGALQRYAVDRFGEHFWVSEWESGPSSRGDARELITQFLRGKQARSAVFLPRPEKGVPPDPQILLGAPPNERFAVKEGRIKIHIQLLGAKHPGLFLDHAPLRQWLMSRARGWKVLNTFAYTGSLSVACGLGDAQEVTTLDLSNPTVEWARQNWALNGLSADRGKFISGDVFEWLPRLKKQGLRYQCVILDPPSFARGKKGTFSTSKDLQKLHELAIDVMADDGVLVTSINSANVTRAKFETEIVAAAQAKKTTFKVLVEISQPETFPSRLGSPMDRYLKGWILQRY